MMAPTLPAGAARGAGGSLVAERNASLASCLVRSTNAICCDPSTARAPLSPQPIIHFLHQNSIMRTFDSFSEREILALAAALHLGFGGALVPSPPASPGRRNEPRKTSSASRKCISRSPL